MNVRFTTSADVHGADVVGIPVFEGRTLPAGSPAPGGLDLGFLEARNFRKGLGQVSLSIVTA